MDEKMTAMVEQMLNRLEQVEKAQRDQGQLLARVAGLMERLEENQRGQTAILQQHGQLLQQHSQQLQQQGQQLQQHSQLLQQQGEDLLKMKICMENDIVPKLDMLFEGHVNLTEQRDRDQREMRRRMRDVEDRNMVLTAQVEGLLKAQ